MRPYNNNQALDGVASRLLSLLGEKERESRFALWNTYIGPGYKNLFKRIIFLREKYIWYVFQKLTKFRFLKTKTTTFFGKKILVNKDSSLRYGFIFDPPEFRLIKFFIKYLKEDDIFYDIGASVGFYSLLAGELITKGEIHCFEPMPDVFRILTGNLEGLKNLHKNEIALSDREDDMVLYEVGDKAGFGTTIGDVAKTYQNETIKEMSIRSTTLQSYLQKHQKPTVIKLDVEGGEGKVIDGGMEFFKNNSPLLVMEVWGGEKGKKFSRNAIDKLYELGYESWAINYEGDLERISDIDLANVRDFENFVFCKRNE